MFWPLNKSFIDQACSVKMAGYWPRSFLRFYGPRLRLGPYKRKKELGQYPAILTSRLVNNAYISRDICTRFARYLINLVQLDKATYSQHYVIRIRYHHKLAISILTIFDQHFIILSVKIGCLFWITRKFIAILEVK